MVFGNDAHRWRSGEFDDAQDLVLVGAEVLRVVLERFLAAAYEAVQVVFMARMVVQLDATSCHQSRLTA
jgi:hypothetical protein